MRDPLHILKTKTVLWSAEPVNVPGVAFSDYESEDAFQIFCADWTRKEHIRTKIDHWKWFHHSANEREGGKAGFSAKMKGQGKGYPDIVQHGLKLAVELKVKNRAASKDQIAWLEYFFSIGYHAEVIRTFDRFKTVVLDRIAEQRLGQCSACLIL